MLSGWFERSGGYAVVDLEATGPSSRRHRVVELAVVLLDRECVPQREFSTLVDPEGPVGPTHIHGIERRHIDDAGGFGAPRFADIAPRLLRLLGGRVLVGHNVGCDRALLVAEYARLGVALPAVPELCTMRMAALRVPAPRGLSLGDCARDAGLRGWDQHTALGDARATARLFAHYVPGQRVESAMEDAAQVAWPWLPGGEALWTERPPTAGPRRRPVPRAAAVGALDGPSGTGGPSAVSDPAPVAGVKAPVGLAGDAVERVKGPKRWNDARRQAVSHTHNGGA